VRKADNLTWQLSGNLGSSTSWNPQGLSRPLYGIVLPLSLQVIFRKCIHYTDWRQIKVKPISAVPSDSAYDTKLECLPSPVGGYSFPELW